MKYTHYQWLDKNAAEVYDQNLETMGRKSFSGMLYVLPVIVCGTFIGHIMSEIGTQQVSICTGQWEFLIGPVG